MNANGLIINLQEPSILLASSSYYNGVRDQLYSKHSATDFTVKFAYRYSPTTEYTTIIDYAYTN